MAKQQQEADVRDSGADPEQRPPRRIAAVGAVLEDAGDQQHAEQRDRQRREHATAWALGEHRPRDQWHEHHLDVGEHRREPGADVHDRVVPEQEVGGEEDPGGEAEAPLVPRARAEAAVLEQRQQRQDRQRIRAAEDRGGRGGRVAEAHEDARERDRYCAQQRALTLAPAHPAHQASVACRELIHD